MPGDRILVTAGEPSVELAQGTVPRFLLPDQCLEMAGLIAQIVEVPQLKGPWQDFLFTLGLERMGWVGIDVHQAVRHEADMKRECTAFDLYVILDHNVMRGRDWSNLKTKLEHDIVAPFRGGIYYSRPRIEFKQTEYCSSYDTPEKESFIRSVIRRFAPLPGHRLLIGALNV